MILDFFVWKTKLIKLQSVFMTVITYSKSIGYLCSWSFVQMKSECIFWLTWCSGLRRLNTEGDGLFVYSSVFIVYLLFCKDSCVGGKGPCVRLWGQRAVEAIKALLTVLLVWGGDWQLHSSRSRFNLCWAAEFNNEPCRHWMINTAESSKTAIMWLRPR